MPKLPFRVDPQSKIGLADYDPADTGDFKDEAASIPKLIKYRERLDELQELLLAECKHSLLVVLQSMDAGGKDGTIRHIFSGMSPQGCQVTSFKVPSQEEIRHDFLWRIHKVTPPSGMIGIFNRSHYEDVLVVRVHKHIDKDEARRRFEEINGFEKTLAQNGTTILKFFLHISKDEQRRRLQERIDNPKKHWKISPSDVEERKLWHDYMSAYEDVFSHTSTKHAPWYIIPANHKLFRNVAISRIIVHTLESLNMKYPKPSFDVSKIRLK